MFGGLNSFPSPRGKSLFASSALLRSNQYFLNTVDSCIAALFESPKLNSGAEGMLQGGNQIVGPVVVVWEFLNSVADTLLRCW
jgi:hypothetical protein